MFNFFVTVFRKLLGKNSGRSCFGYGNAEVREIVDLRLVHYGSKALVRIFGNSFASDSTDAAQRQAIMDYVRYHNLGAFFNYISRGSSHLAFFVLPALGLSEGSSAMLLRLCSDVLGISVSLDYYKRLTLSNELQAAGADVNGLEVHKAQWTSAHRTLYNAVTSAAPNSFELKPAGLVPAGAASAARGPLAPRPPPSAVHGAAFVPASEAAAAKRPRVSEDGGSARGSGGGGGDAGGAGSAAGDENQPQNHYTGEQ